MDGKQACEKMVSVGQSLGCGCVHVHVQGPWQWKRGVRTSLSLPLLFTTPLQPLTDPGPRTGLQPLPCGTEQDLLPGRCPGPARRGAGPKGHRHHRVLPGSCPRIPSSQVGHRAWVLLAKAWGRGQGRVKQRLQGSGPPKWWKG